MTAVVTLLNEIQHESSRETSFAIKAKPFTKGSFEIQLEVIAYTGILLLHDVPLIEHTISMLKNCFGHLINSRRAVRDSVSLSNVNVGGDLMMVQTLTVNNTIHLPPPDAQAKSTDASRDLLADETIKSVEICRGKKRSRKKIIEIPREDFPLLASVQDDEQVLPRRDRKTRETLIVAAPDLMGNGKWRFTLAGVSIWAGFKDQDFMRKVSTGKESFNAGDQLVVDLVTHQLLNEVTLNSTSKVTQLSM